MSRRGYSLERNYDHTLEHTLTGGSEEDGSYWECDVEFKVNYNISWGEDPSGLHGPPEDYDPGSPDEVEDAKLVQVISPVLYNSRGDLYLLEIIKDKVEDGEFDDQLLQHAKDML